jgi:biotin-dependent carboxylase-like uncharacterized protein
MTPALRVLDSGLLTTVQDLGRIGYQHLGLTVSGALDPLALRAANELVGNDQAAGCLEIMYRGPKLLVEAEDVRIGFAGANATIEILPDQWTSEGIRISSMRTVRMRHGEVIRVGSLAGSAVLYLAVAGGFALQPVLGSVSTDLRAGVGGWQGRALGPDDRLPLRRDTTRMCVDSRLSDIDLSTPSQLRVILGPQDDHFAQSEISRFFDSTYTVAADSDRMGLRLDGPRLEHLAGYNIPSDATPAGSIQIPGNGLPIVLMNDRQTTGGYPKIATVISADLPALGRVSIGSKIRFEPVTLALAHQLRAQLIEQYRNIASRVVPLKTNNINIPSNLLGSNLISGVVDAHGHN